MPKQNKITQCDPHEKEDVNTLNLSELHVNLKCQYKMSTHVLIDTYAN